MSEKTITLVVATNRCLRCTECDGTHHFSDMMIETPDREEDTGHPAVLIGLPCWYVCKHCPAWTVDPEEETAIFEGVKQP